MTVKVIAPGSGTEPLDSPVAESYIEGQAMLAVGGIAVWAERLEWPEIERIIKDVARNCYRLGASHAISGSSAKTKRIATSDGQDETHTDRRADKRNRTRAHGRTPQD